MSQKLPPEQVSSSGATLLPKLETRRRAHLLAVLERLRSASPEMLSEPARTEMEALARKFEESRFYLVFLGQFKRGKTSLLNRLLGADLLPVGVLPLTSIVTVVRHGSQPGARVHFSDGTQREITLDEIAEYATERGNPKNRKGVAEVEVFFPSPWLEAGLCLIDTPGIGSAFEHNTQVAYQFVPRADAAIFVFSPESPLTQPELEFLHHIRNSIGKIFFVLNKADQVSDAERREILEFARQVIREQMPSGELRFFPVSARLAAEADERRDSAGLEASGLVEFRRALERFLERHAADLLVESTRAALARVVRDERLTLELESRALKLSAEELQSKIGLIEQAWKVLDARHREAGYVLRGEVRGLEERLERELKAFAESETPRLRQKMKTELDRQGALPKPRLAAALDQALRSQVLEAAEEWRGHEDEILGDAFAALTARFTGEATKTLERIQQVAAEQFGFSWAAAPLPERLEVRPGFEIETDRLVGWGLGRFPLLLPRRLFARYLARRLEEACLLELGRCVGKLREDLGDRLERGVNEYLQALDRHLEEARNSVLAALSRAASLAQSSEDESVAEKRSLAARQSFLRDAEEDLARISEGEADRRLSP
jgi:GTPase SAR1 family protein